MRALLCPPVTFKRFSKRNNKHLFGKGLQSADQRSNERLHVKHAAVIKINAHHNTSKDGPLEDEHLLAQSQLICCVGFATDLPAVWNSSPTVGRRRLCVCPLPAGLPATCHARGPQTLEILIEKLSQHARMAGRSRTEQCCKTCLCPKKNMR